MLNLNYKDYFNHLFPGFFERESIKNLPEENIAEEMIMDLHEFFKDEHKLSCPECITFGLYNGEMDALHAAVREVDEAWVQYFKKGDRIYCAFDGERVVSFCQLSDFGVYGEWKVGGPGCVGTIPAYRRQGIGLKMIQNATAILKAEGYDISHIHYTGVAPWYAHLEYQPILKWNCKGFVDFDSVEQQAKAEAIKQLANEAHITPELTEYIHTNILPVYAKNDKAHQLDHIAYVIRRSLLFMEQFEGLNADMVYTIAAYHDIAHHIDKDNHDTLSATAFENDTAMRNFFSEEQIQIIKNAIEDHRASLEYVPRSDYGKIVSSADRSADVDSFIRRTHDYSLTHFPEYTEEQNIERCYQHMKDKYGAGGYAKHYVVDEEYIQFQEMIKELIADRKAFENKYRAINYSM